MKVTLALLCSLIVANGTVLGQTQQAEPELVEAAIRFGRGGYLEAEVDLGKLMAGKQSVFLLRMHNETDLSIPILKMTTTCGCLKANSLVKFD